jgi:hypothetical protein
MGFCSASRTGERIPFRNRHIEVRILAPQPGIPAFGQSSLETREWVGNPGLSRILAELIVELLKASGLVREYSRFAETIGRARNRSSYGSPSIGRRVWKSLRIAKPAVPAARCLSVCPLTAKRKKLLARNSSSLAAGRKCPGFFWCNCQTYGDARG